ncbi:DUF3524 domain-containing protein [Lentisphaerota bacterium WC36G]|nr:DUF3524 domain-containing protein [Lentisphaerae bacterium WC36]
MNNKPLKILAFEPFYGGSHKHFIDDVIKHSEHDWKLMTLPESLWRWRSRTSSIDFFFQLEELKSQLNPDNFDLIFTTSLINVAELKGFCSDLFNNKKTVCYYHENQLAYPIPQKGKQHIDAALVNIKSALAADELWFNSKHNLDSFTEKISAFSTETPEPLSAKIPDHIKEKAIVMPLGIKAPPQSVLNLKIGHKKEIESPLHLVWAARWEYDKNFADFFKALLFLEHKNVDFRISVLGVSENFRPKEFDKCFKRFEDRILNWGFAPSKEDYFNILATADLFVSTAIHEFFGISVVEAAMCATPVLLPNRLAYVELFNPKENPQFFYDGTAQDLEQKLYHFATNLIISRQKFIQDGKLAKKIAMQYQQQKIIKLYDKQLTKLANGV